MFGSAEILYVSLASPDDAEIMERIANRLGKVATLDDPELCRLSGSHVRRLVRSDAKTSSGSSARNTR